MNRKTLLVVAVLAAMGAGTALAAAQADSATRPARVNPDNNNDGVIDRTEAAALPRLAEKFDALDKNKDGKLTADERPQRDGMRGERHGGGKGHKGAAFAKLDTDKDGKLSRAEAAADPKFAERFEKMDLNKDGVIDRADREVAAKHREERFAAADTNKDGKLSRDEAKANPRMAEHFDRLDANKDGFVGKDELPARREAKR